MFPVERMAMASRLSFRAFPSDNFQVEYWNTLPSNYLGKTRQYCAIHPSFPFIFPRSILTSVQIFPRSVVASFSFSAFFFAFYLYFVLFSVIFSITGCLFVYNSPMFQLFQSKFATIISGLSGCLCKNSFLYSRASSRSSQIRLQQRGISYSTRSYMQ